MASRLSEDAACSVLLLEAGRAYTPDTYHDALKDVSGNTVEPQYICVNCHLSRSAEWRKFRTKSFVPRGISREIASVNLSIRP